MVAIVGEAGVGKSRLVYEFTHSHRVQDWLILEASSVSYGKATSYLPVIDLLKGYFKIGDRDDHREMRAKVLGRVLGLDRGARAPAAPAARAARRAGRGPGLAEPGPAAAPPAHARRGQAPAAAREPGATAARGLRGPALDRWRDPGPARQPRGEPGSARLLLLVNYRPEYEHRWGSKTAYSQLRLDSLPAESAAELLAALLGPDPGLAPLTQMLVKRGNPFFLEETVRTLVETGALAGERGAYRLTRPVEALQVPATVQTILAARIDRLPAEEKRLLQAASVIGKHVPYALLAAIAEQPEETLRRGLAHLQEAEFLYETQLFPDLEYTFKHALTHDVAYAGLLGERRRDLHAAVAAAIERLHADRLVEHVERLAHHARQGEVWDKAVRYLRQAGTKAFLRSANREAATYFEQALDALRRLPENPDAIAESLDIRFDLRTALLPLGELGRMGTLLDEVEALAEAVGDERRLGRALNYKVIHFSQAGDSAAAIQAGLRALAIGESQADVALQVVANSYLGRAYVLRGDCREAVRHCEAALVLIPEGLAQERFGQATIQGSYVRATLARALGALGRFAEAFGCLREAMHIAEEEGHVFTLLFPVFDLGILKLDHGDFAGAAAPLERGLDLCRTRQVLLPLHDFTWALGAAYHATGRRAEGLALMEDAARGAGSERTARSIMVGRPSRGARGGVPRRRAAGGLLRGSPMTDLRRLGSAGNGAWRAGFCDCSGTSRRIRTASRSIQRRPTIARRWPWPSPVACAPRRPLPPRPRQALPAHRSARPGARAPRHRDDDVPRHGHAVLAGAGGCRAERARVSRCPPCRSETPTTPSSCLRVWRPYRKTRAGPRTPHHRDDHVP